MGLVYLAVFVMSLALSLLLPFPLRRFCERHDLVDKPAPRTVHLRAVPTLGGTAIWVSFFVAAFAGGALSGHLVPLSPELKGLFFGGTMVFLLGLYDDLRPASAWIKILVQISAALVLARFGYRIEVVASPFGGALSLGLFSIPFTVVWVVGVVNALNFIDGLDGLAAGITAIAGVSLFVAGLQLGFGLSSLFAIGIVGSALGFLRHNFYPAKVFMGDTGSMFLGFCLAAISLAGAGKSVALVALLVPVAALGLPILDVLLAVIRRTKKKANIFQADKEHIHHRLLSLGLSHPMVVLVLYGVSVLLGALAVGLATADRKVVASIVLVILIAIGFGVFGLRLFQQRCTRS